MTMHQARPSRRTDIIMRVNEAADTFYDKSQDFGTIAADAFREREAEEKKHRSQLTGLENIAETTTKVSDVLDYIKRQTARQDGWKAPYDKKRLGEILGYAQEDRVQKYVGQCFGEILKNYIENDLGQVRANICSALGIGQKDEQDLRDRQQIHLYLIRQFVRQIVVQYEYLVDAKKRKSIPKKDGEQA